MNENLTNIGYDEPALSVLTLPEGLDSVLEADTRTLIEHDILPYYVRQRRWFASKDKAICFVKFGSLDKLDFSSGSVLLSEILISGDGINEIYQLPLGIAWDDETYDPLAQRLSLAPVLMNGRKGMLTDAFTLDLFALGLLHALRDQTVFPVQNGEIDCSSTKQFSNGDIETPVTIRRLTVEQSNSSLVMGNRFIVKLIRRVMDGVNPEIEMSRFLTLAGYKNTPPLLGEVNRVKANGPECSIFVVQEFTPNQGDAWEYTLNYLSEPRANFFDYFKFAEVMGKRLAQLHALLAQATGNSNFAPMQVTRKDADAWAEGVERQIIEAYERLHTQKQLDNDILPQIEFAFKYKNEILELLPALAQAGIGSLQTRIHGDFHLGQILVVNEDASIIDFEGEPAKTIEHRRAKASPLRDVAGLLRSFSYAAAMAKAGQSTFAPEASAQFLMAYRQVERAASPRWTNGDVAEAALLDLFLLEKSAYEICYEAANRPTWLGIPLRGFTDTIARVRARLNEMPDG